MKVVLKRLNDAVHMEARNEDNVVMHFDGTKDIGGQNLGVRPMQSLLMAMGGCSAIDVLMILKKQRQVVEDFTIEIEGERESGKEPALWKKAHVLFIFKGSVDADKAQRAVELSMDKYCSVAETLRRAGAIITYETKIVS